MKQQQKNNNKKNTQNVKYICEKNNFFINNSQKITIKTIGNT